MKVKLVKLKSNHNNLRTNEMVGECTELPIVGNSFVIFGQPIDKNAAVRVIQTTPVKDVQRMDQTLTFGTQNSSYQLWLL